METTSEAISAKRVTLRSDRAKVVLLAWAESGGFAATHGAGATSEAIVEDLLGFLEREGWALVRRSRPPGP